MALPLGYIPAPPLKFLMAYNTQKPDIYQYNRVTVYLRKSFLVIMIWLICQYFHGFWPKLQWYLGQLWNYQCILGHAVRFCSVGFIHHVVSLSEKRNSVKHTLFIPIAHVESRTQAHASSMPVILVSRQPEYDWFVFLEFSFW